MANMFRAQTTTRFTSDAFHRKVVGGQSQAIVSEFWREAMVLLPSAPKSGTFESPAIKLPDVGKGDLTFTAVMPPAQLNDPSVWMDFQIWLSPDNIQWDLLFGFTWFGGMKNYTDKQGIIHNGPFAAFDRSAFLGKWIKVKTNLNTSVLFGIEVSV